MITVTVHDGHYNREHLLDDMASVSDLIEVLNEYRNAPMIVFASQVEIRHEPGGGNYVCGDCDHVGLAITFKEDEWGNESCPECGSDSVYDECDI